MEQLRTERMTSSRTTPRPLKVAYPMRVDALDKPGGDVVLMRTYIRYCTELAAQRGFRFEGVILTELAPDLSGFDAVHLTNLDRPIDLYAQFLAARRAGGPTIVLTPLHHSFREIERYERHGRGGLIGRFSGLIGFNQLETLRILLKSRRYPALRPALARAVRKGIRRAQSEVLAGCDFILVAADKETEDIRREIASLPGDRFTKVRNGFQVPSAPVCKPADEVHICVVSRIEARKNQIAILDALESLNLRAVFVGSENPNHQRYCEVFKQRIRTSRSTYIPGVPPAEVAPILARSHVHVAASWFEVSSLVDIDAYVLGCRVVASRCGGTQELLEDDAYYVDPGSTEDIARQIALAVESVRAATVNDVASLVDKLESWETIADRLLAMYTHKPAR